MSLRAISARFFVALALFFALAVPTQAQTATQPKTVKVGVYVNPPFIIKHGNVYEGIAFELWQGIARREGLVSNFVDYPTVRQLLAATEAGEIDVAIGNLTITRDRSTLVDFSYPWHDGGLRILTSQTGGAGIGDIVTQLGDGGYLRSYLWLGFFVIAATVLLTVFDRRFDKDFPRGWLPGIAESFHHVISMAMTGRTSRKQLFGAAGRFFSAFWMVCGVAVVAYLTSSVTSVMAVTAVTDQIQGIDDLRQRTVGVLGGGASELYADSIGLATRPFDSLDKAIAALDTEDVDAVMADHSVLEYYVHELSQPGLSVVGPMFKPEKYGFATPKGSPLTDIISLDLLTAHEDGTIDDLQTRYVGSLTR